jgi:hypothetical protein
VDSKVERLLSIEDPPDELEPEERHGFFDSKTLKRASTKAKQIFKTVFTVLWKFSGFLMPAAATIPIIGSGLSFLSQAIQILINTTKNYHAILEKAAELFEQVGFFSMRFDMLMEAEKDGASVHPKFVRYGIQPGSGHGANGLPQLGPVPQCHSVKYSRLCCTLHQTHSRC